MATAWKRREAEAASLVGARRAVLSGSSGRSDRDSSDTTHPRLHVEVKLKASHSIFTLWRKTKKLCGKKTPVLMLAEKFHEGFLICVHTADLLEFIEEMCVPLDDQTLNDLCERIRLRRIEREGIDATA